MEILGQASLQTILFIVIYSITGVVPLIAALYLLLRQGNAFASDVTPPLRLRRWAASFFAVSALGHVWWLLFCILSGDIRSADDLLHSIAYLAVVFLDWVTLLPTIAGTLLSMLQDRHRPVWPVFVAMIPIVVMGSVLMGWPNEQLIQVAAVYVLLLYLLFTVYVAFAVRQYGRWLRDNYADLERKEVWLTHVLSLVFVLLFILYTLVDINTILLMFLLHFTELVLFVLLLWRVETLQNLKTLPQPLPVREGSGQTQGETYGGTHGGTHGETQGETQGESYGDNSAAELYTPLPSREGQGGGSPFDLAQIERLLNEHCVATQLYLQHELSRDQLAQAVGTNRSYLSQYFSRQGITYNTYINNLRVNHFISRYEEGIAAGQPVSVKQLAHESGFGSYRTFSRAFTERTGQSVTAWMGEREW